MKKMKIVLLIVAFLGVLVYLYFPWNLTTEGFWVPGWWQKSLFNFCKYTAPEGYKVIAYSEGAPGYGDDKYLIIFQDQNTGQLISVSRLRGFHFVPLNQVEIGNKDFGQPMRITREHILDNFKVLTYLPVWHFLRQDNQGKLPQNLLLEGFSVKRKNEFSTDNANVLYLNGSFQKIGFFKRMPFPQAFATPVFDFLSSQKGSLAILNNKKSNETIIVVSSIASYQNFDEESVKKFIFSLSFDKEFYKPALLEGIDEPKTKMNLSF